MEIDKDAGDMSGFSDPGKYSTCKIWHAKISNISRYEVRRGQVYLGIVSGSCELIANAISSLRLGILLGRSRFL